MSTVSVLSGRKWKRSRDKKNSITVKYRAVLDTAISVGSEGEGIDGIPTPGTEHATLKNLEVSSVDYEEESSPGGEKIVVATVTYEPKESSTETITQQEESVTYRVEEWGWDSGTEEKPLLDAVDSTAQNPKPVVNSAGDPFDSVPNVTTPAPVFTKVMKFKARQTGAMGYACKVNDVQVTIGGMTCPIGTLLCFVSEKRIFGDKDWNYAYTIQLKFKSNIVKLYGDNETTELGWDVGLVDAGMRQKDVNDATGKKKVLIHVIDEETHQERTVSSPALLDGNGYAISPTDNDQGPRNLRFKAHERASFPSWFYSEPPIPIDNDDEDDEDDVANN